MKTSKLINSLFGLLLVCMLAAVSVVAQENPPPIRVTTTNSVAAAQEAVVKANSVVRGRAVYDDTNRPVRRARVMLLEMNGRGPERIGTTNASGEFQIKEVPAGSYFVMVDAAGIITPISFVDLADAMTSSEKFNVEEIKKHFDEVVVDGTNDVTVKVRARRGGAISGKVTYSDGDPAINVRVSIMRKKDGHVARFITNLNPSAFFGIQTDDRGMYRVAGLPPGEYIVSASETVDHDGDSGNQRGGDYMGMFGGANSLVVTYYPGVAKQSGASPIQIDAGQEQNETNITLLDRGLHTLSGTVVARHDAAPLKGAQVSIVSKDEAVTTNIFSTVTGVSTDEQGRFTFNEIPDGVYTLTVEPPYAGQDVDVEMEEDEEEQAQPAPTPSAPAAPKRKFTRKQQDVTVNGSDINDVAITLTEGASISGTVTVEGGTLPRGFSVTLQSANNQLTDNQEENIRPDGTFTIDGVAAGAFYMDVSTLGQSEQYYVKTMTVNGIDLTSNPLVLSENANVSNVRVVLSPDAATLSGRVLSGNSTPVSGSQLVLVTTDQSKWRAHAADLLVVSEENGSYSVSGAPGDYFIIFLRPGDHASTINEAWIRDRIANAQRVTLLPREHKNMDLTAPTQ